ncbi:MAG: hypothetical protein ABH871_00565 [Pseudomonadota bacterium]
MLFFRVNKEFLTQKRVRAFVWTDLIIGAIALGFAIELHGCKWSIMFAVVSVVCLIDSSLMRYLYEIKRAVRGATQSVLISEESSDT